MSSSLCINVQLLTSIDKEDIVFFSSDDWTIDTERNLFVKLHELFDAVRPVSTSMQINLNICVKDYADAMFVINDKINNPSIIKPKLSVREIEILGMIMQGNTNQEIAAKLFISYETVKSHRKNILEKTGARNTAALINYYHQTFFDK